MTFLAFWSWISVVITEKSRQLGYIIVASTSILIELWSIGRAHRVGNSTAFRLISYVWVEYTLSLAAKTYVIWIGETFVWRDLFIISLLQISCQNIPFIIWAHFVILLFTTSSLVSQILSKSVRSLFFFDLKETCRTLIPCADFLLLPNRALLRSFHFGRDL